MHKGQQSTKLVTTQVLNSEASHVLGYDSLGAGGGAQFIAWPRVVLQIGGGRQYDVEAMERQVASEASPTAKSGRRDGGGL